MVLPEWNEVNNIVDNQLGELISVIARSNIFTKRASFDDVTKK